MTFYALRILQAVAAQRLTCPLPMALSLSTLSAIPSATLPKGGSTCHHCESPILALQDCPCPYPTKHVVSPALWVYPISPELRDCSTCNLPRPFPSNFCSLVDLCSPRLSESVVSPSVGLCPETTSHPAPLSLTLPPRCTPRSPMLSAYS